MEELHHDRLLRGSKFQRQLAKGIRIFAAWRAAAGLPTELSVHCLRHSYISQGVEDGMDPLFLHYQAGHSWASSTAGYTKVGSDHMNKMLRSALDRAFLRVEQ